MKSAMDVKVNVKPVFSNVVHSAIWEGPCRVGEEETLSPTYESRAGHEEFRIWSQKIKKNLDAFANVLEPVYLEYDENFFVSDDQLKEIAPEPSEVDLFLSHIGCPALNAWDGRYQ